MKSRVVKYLLSVLLIVLLWIPELSFAAEVNYNGVESIELSKTSLNLYVGDREALSYKYHYARQYNSSFKFTWSSSNKKIATVSNGIVTAVSSGKATITIISGTATATCNVVVSMSESQKKVEKKANSIISKKIKNDMSTVQKIKTIHDYIVSTTKYDYDNYLDGTIPAISYTIEGVLLKKTAVCQGYAETFKLFMDKLHIPCKIVSGTAGGGSHAWNMVKLGGSWYWIDVTWDDPTPDTGRIHYQYFLVSDSELKKDHSWNKSKYSATGTKYKYYGYKDCTIEKIGQISSLVKKQNSKDYLTIVCSKSIKDEALKEATNQFRKSKRLNLSDIVYIQFSVGKKVGYQIYNKNDK